MQKFQSQEHNLSSEEARINEDPMRFFMNQLRLTNYLPGNKDVDLMI